MKYICNICESTCKVKVYDDIIKMEKMCKRCLSKDEHDRNRIKKAIVYNKKNNPNNSTSLRRVKRTTGKKRKGKQNKKFTWICNHCQEDSELDFKPYSCNRCNMNSFFRKEVR